MYCKNCASNILLIIAVLLVPTQSTADVPSKANDGDDNDEDPVLTRDQFEDKLNEEPRMSCHPEWMPFSNDSSSPFTHCIKVFMTFRMTWQQAEESCTHFSGAHLISLNDAQHLQWINTAVKSEAISQFRAPWLQRMYKRTPHSGWWVGLGQLCPNEDVKRMPKMRWTDGRIYDDANETTIGGVQIKIPKPEEWSKQYCVSYHYEKGTNGKAVAQYFNMSECTERRNFICKMPALSQEQSIAGFVFYEKEEDKSAELIEEQIDEMSDEYPCGKDPLYCPLKDDRGEVTCYHLLNKAHFWQQSRQACCGKDPLYCPLKDDRGEVTCYHLLNKAHFWQQSRQACCGKDPLYCPLKDDRGEVTCYHLLNKAHFWQQSRQACEAEYDSDLASIHSKKESDFIYQLATMQPSVTGETKYWIGLHRRNAQRQYEWSDGSPLNYMEFRTSDDNDDEGNELGACNVLKLNTSTRSLLSTALYDKLSIVVPPTKQEPVYSWMHQRCDNKRLAICQKAGFGTKKEIKLSKKEKQKSSFSSWKCSEGFKLFRGMCYKVFGTRKGKGQTFDEAKKSCESVKSTLVSLTDPYEQGFVLSMLRGLNSDAWIGMDMMAGRVRWMDAEPVQMTRFSPDNRVIRIGNDKHVFQNVHLVGFSQDACVSLDATTLIGYWDLTFNVSEIMLPTTGEKKILSSGQCGTKKLPFICEKYAEEADENSKGKPCYTNGDVTYCFLSSDEDKNLNGHYTFTEGKHICSTLHQNDAYSSLKISYGQLAQADDLFEWSFLTATALQNGYEQFYMGVEFKKDLGFVRTDGIRVRLAPWSNGEPNLKNGNCVVTKLGREGPAWFMAPCSGTRQLVCRLSKEEPMAELEPDFRCPKGKENWILGETHCYHLVTNTSLISSGYKADHDCFKLYNAGLASFETREDFVRFKQQIIHEKLAVASAFIGLIKQDKDTFAWKDLSPLTFVNWDQGEPGDAYGRESEECVQMKLKEDFVWQTVTCWQNRHFICSVPVIGKNIRDPDPKSSVDEGDDKDVPDLPSPEEENDNDGDIKIHDGKEDPEKERTDEKKSHGEKEAPTAKPRNTDVHKDVKDGLDKTTDKNKRTEDNVIEIGGGDSIQKSSSGSGVPVGSIVAAIVGVTFAAAIAVFFIRRRTRGASHVREQRIMQFDSLQNEDEYGGI
ncbi:Macrophage mannose receptor 1 [Toxocara canis]|uniref:Macrophage mannose receptor 1 n=1 Tax=Toxocara canis TaxID=6265 RepID=A0A0B2UYG0_TOXCA|nr:Macrophage mannose receptor 1 [Toxocara canis]